MPVPVDPFPNFIPGTLIDADQVDARLKKLYDTLDPAIIGIDVANLKDLSVTTAKLAAAAVTAAKIEAQQAWQTGALAVILSGTIAYYKDSLGIVHVRADSWTGIPSVSGTAFTFPAGYRPGSTINLMVRGSNATNTLGVTLDSVGVLSGTTGTTGIGAGMFPVGWSWRAEG